MAHQWWIEPLFAEVKLVYASLTCTSQLFPSLLQQLLLLNIMSHLGEAPSYICRFLEFSFAAKNYRPYTEKHSAMRKPVWPRVSMPDPMLVRISPGDKLSGTEILMKQKTKAQGVTLDNSTNADAEKETRTGWQTRRQPNTSRHEYQAN